ncbi:hypothetical protein H8356DRAFT_1354551 [Neocallimastix lanati (nom. inval.)]|nr:hypothetical protein H8356DRAFT_1354551 [Neocallimastix sp. JGI-2020a]
MVKKSKNFSNESEYYKTKRDESFVIFKNTNIIVFQSSFQAELFSKHNDIFGNGIFYVTQKFSNQIFYYNILNAQKIFHCDFEIGISNDVKNVFLINNINYKIKSEFHEHNFAQFLKFLDYFEKTYLKSYKMEYWNYYINREHKTNNASESYNNY